MWESNTRHSGLQRSESTNQPTPFRSTDLKEELIKSVATENGL